MLSLGGVGEGLRAEFFTPARLPTSLRGLQLIDCAYHTRLAITLQAFTNLRALSVRCDVSAPQGHKPLIADYFIDLSLATLMSLLPLLPILDHFHISEDFFHEKGSKRLLRKLRNALRKNGQIVTTAYWADVFCTDEHPWITQPTQ